MKLLYLTLAMIFFAIQLMAIKIFSPLFQLSDYPLVLSVDTLATYIVFGLAPVLLCAFTLSVIIFQWKQQNPLDLLFGLVVVASLVLAHSWGMHSFVMQSVAYSIVSIALGIFGLIKIYGFKK